TEVWIASRLLCVADEPERSALLVDSTQLRDIPLPAGDLALELSRREIVEIELTPIIALGEPDHFIRGGENMPVHSAITRLVLRRNIFPEDIAHAAGRRIGNPEYLVLVIARCRDERNVRPVGIPLHISPFRPSADH